MRYAKLLVFLCVLLLLLVSCAKLKQPSPSVNYYTLEYPPPQSHGRMGLPIVLRVRRFAAASVYNTNRMIYRNADFKRQTYNYHRWRANPGDLVADFLSRDLKHSGLFRAVLPTEVRTPASYTLEGSVDEFLEWDGPETWEAVLALTVTLLAENEPDVSRRILFQRTYRKGEICEERSPEALAGAMSRAMSALSGEILRDVYSELRKRPEVISSS